MSQDKSMVKEAREIIKGIKQFQNTATDKFANFDRQVEDLKLAQRKLQEAQSVAKPVQMSGGDSRLKSFLKQDGSIQLGTETKKIQVKGQGTFEADVEGLLTTKTPANDWHKKLIDLTQERAWCRSLMTNPHTPKTDLKIYKHIEKAPAEIKTAVTRAFYDAAGAGAEFIPDQFRAELYETFQVPRNLRALMPVVEMQNNTMIIPRMGRGGRPYIKGQVSTDNPANYQASTVLTESKTIAVKGFATRYVVDDGAAEDSALALMPILTRQIASDLEDAWEDCWINGDASGTLGDALGSWNVRSRWGVSGLGGADDHRKAFDGLRQRAFAAGTQAAGTAALATTSEILGRISSMAELGVGNLYIVASPEAMIKHLMGNSDLLTMDKFGPNASLVSGSVASIFGHSVLMSRFISSDLAASGKYTGAGSQTGILFYNAASFSQYQKRGVTVETDKNIGSGSIEIVASMRNVVASVDAANSKNCAFLRDLNS
jgi:HK97 family phage major capsid protein